MPFAFTRAYPPLQPKDELAYWLPFLGEEVLVQEIDQQVSLIQGDQHVQDVLGASEVYYLGTLHGVPCLTCEVDAERQLPAEWRTASLYGLYGRIDEEARNLVGYASGILRWQRTSRYCPVCGHMTEPVAGTWGRTCPNCGHTNYPPVTPAILALVYDNKRVLLTHKPGWGKRYSCIAGFVEPGESMEECVQREVYEEVGLEVADVTYMGSQPWPFPHQVMVGYVARYVSGDIRLDEQELDDARWFELDELPQLPPPHSLANKLILTWVEHPRNT